MKVLIKVTAMVLEYGCIKSLGDNDQEVIIGIGFKIASVY